MDWLKWIFGYEPKELMDFKVGTRVKWLTQQGCYAVGELLRYVNTDVVEVQLLDGTMLKVSVACLESV